MLQILQTMLSFILVLGILVFVHEFGHFIMAKRAGVRVEKFSLGMGPRLFGYKKGDTDYIISALPLGGYVKMAGENPDEEPTGAADEFASKTVWQRAKIAAAGSLTNIALAFVLMPLVYMVGTYAEGPAKVGFVEKGSPAEKAGFQAGDVIEEINGRRISDWTKALSLIAVNPDTEVRVLLDRNGEKKALSLRPEAATELRIGSSGLVPDMPAEIGRLRPGLPADKAGIKVNDRILAVDGRTIYHWNQFSLLVKDSGGKDLSILLERGGKRVEQTVKPVMDGGRYVIGVEPAVRLVFKKYGVIESVQMGFRKTLETADLTFITLKKLFSFSLSIKTLGGPVMIAQMSGQAASAGLSAFIALMATISLSLGMLNLLPIPVLDGGMLVFLAIEALRKKPLSQKVMEVSQGIGAALLITLIAVVSYNDVMRLFFSK
jgi:regulator of sigma E protease